MMRFLTIENIILFHEKIVKETGGSAGIRDRGLIESALNMSEGREFSCIAIK